MQSYCLPLAFVLFSILIGCNSNRENAELLVADAMTTQPDASEFVLIVARHLFDEYAPKDGSASPSGFHCFIVGEPHDTPEFLAAFADFRIPVLGSERLILKNDSPYDKETDQHAMLWKTFDVKNISDSQATVYVEWMLGPDGAAGYTVQLEQSDGDWIVKSVKEDWMS